MPFIVMHTERPRGLRSRRRSKPHTRMIKRHQQRRPSHPAHLRLCVMDCRRIQTKELVEEQPLRILPDLSSAELQPLLDRYVNDPPQSENKVHIPIIALGLSYAVPN